MLDNPRHSAAIALALAGIPVFPCVPGGKQPATENGFKDRTTDLTKINTWYSYADFNIAIVPEDQKQCVTDLDVKKNDGVAAWNRLSLEHGDENFTKIVKTPSGGFHRYYSGSLRASAGKLAKGIDTRGIDSYVLVPPSVIDGKFYEIVRDGDPAPLPAWVAEAIGNTDRVNGFRAGLIAPELLDLEINIYRAGVYLASLVDQGLVAQPGDRDETTFRVAADMLDLGLSPGCAAGVMRDQWAPYCVDLFGENSDLVEWKLASAFEKKQREGSLGCDAIVDGSTLFSEAIRQDHQPVARGGFVRFRTRRPSELVALPAIECWDREKMWPRVPDDGAVAVLYGAGGNHKTNIVLTKLMDLMTSPQESGPDIAASYLNDLEPRRNSRPRVVYAAGEGSHGLGQRIQAHCRYRGIEASSLDDWFLEISVPIIANENDMGEFADKLDRVEKFKPDIIVIDTLATALAGMEEDTRAAGLLTRNGSVGRLAGRYGALVLVVAHSGKDEKRGIRGSGAFADNVDAVMLVHSDRTEGKTASAVEVRLEKMRDGADGIRTHYALHDVQGVPVPVKCSEHEYKFLTKETAFSEGEIRGKLLAMQALDAGSGKSTLALAAQLFPREKLDPEQWAQALERIAKRLERDRLKWAIFNNVIDQEPELRWFTR